MADLLDSLNAQQREAVTHEGGPLLIVAGPGTGKTRTLTARIAFLVSQRGVEPSCVLAVTFSNRAASEMRERLVSLLPRPAAAQVTIGTFHAICWQILRRELGQTWSLCPEDARLAIVRRVLRDADADAPKVAAAISRHKSSPVDARDGELSPAATELGLTPGVFRAYQAALDANGLFDFDDLILRTVGLFERSRELLEHYRRRFRQIAVDEFQDTNAAQARLLELIVRGQSGATNSDPSPLPLSPEGRGECAVAETPALTVIGDPDQAIYAFRGATGEQFQRLASGDAAVRVVRLSRSYRASPAIAAAAGALIAHNAGRENTPLESHAAPGPRPQVYQADSEEDEARFVVRQIRRLMGGLDRQDFDTGAISSQEPDEHFSFADFAVLYRLHAIGAALAEAFGQSSIPFQRIGGPLAREQEETRDLIAALRVLVNPQDAVSGERLAMDRTSGLSLASVERLRPLCNADCAATTALKLVRDALETTDAATLGAWERLIARVGPLDVTLGEFLRQLDLETPADLHDPRADKVALMTLHAAKGLEFSVVFLVGCEAGVLPYRPPGQSAPLQAEAEEERRLFYVGMTRAKRRLHLSWAGSRFLFGRRVMNQPSLFLEEIPAALKDCGPTAPLAGRARRRGAGQQRLFRG